MERITSLEDFLTRGSSQLVNTRFNCPLCGREHVAPSAAWLRPSVDVAFEPDALSRSPLPGLHSALGFVASAASASADWKLVSLIQSSYFCPLPYLMTVDHRARCFSTAGGLAAPYGAEPDALQALAEAGQMTVLAESIIPARPSPLLGAAATLSDYWDFQASTRGLPANHKGTQLGLATVIVLALFETLRGLDTTDLKPDALLGQRQSLDALLAENAALYGSSAGQVETAARQKYLPDDQYLERAEAVLSRWSTLWKELDPYLSPAASVREPLRSAGFPLTLAGINRTPQDALEALLYSSRFSTRSSVLDLAWDLGVLPHAAQVVLERAGVL